MFKYSLAIACLMSVFAASEAAAQTSLSDLLGLVDDDAVVVLSEGGALDPVSSGALDTTSEIVESVLPATRPANTSCQPPRHHAAVATLNIIPFTYRFSLADVIPVAEVVFPAVAGEFRCSLLTSTSTSRSISTLLVQTEWVSKVSDQREKIPTASGFFYARTGTKLPLRWRTR